MVPWIFRAPACPVWPIICLALGTLPGSTAPLTGAAALGAGPTPAAEPAAPVLFPDDEPPRGPVGAFEVVRRFDFDERPLGNYEETPLNWMRLDGDGLPRYSTARLDDDYGHLAPPSFRFDLQGGSIAYEYVGDDLPLTAGAEHLVAGYVRAVGLRQARAFVQITLLNQAGERIPGSDRISNLVGSTRSPVGGEAGPAAQPIPLGEFASANEPWQRIEVAVPTDFHDATALRLTLWVLQSYAWREAAEVDPILRQDIGARAWFDDLALYRLPHTGLRLSTGGALVREKTPASFVIESYSPAAAALRCELSIKSAAGQTIHTVCHSISQTPTRPLETPVPPLEPGSYTAQLRLCDASDSFAESDRRFAVISELPRVTSSCADFGIDLGEVRSGDADALIELVRELGCGAVKLGFPLPTDDTADNPVEAARDLVRGLLAAGIDPIGVLLPAHRAGVRGGPPTSQKPEPGAQMIRTALLAADRAALLAPLLIPLGNAVSCWQIGEERTEVGDDAGWGDARGRSADQRSAATATPADQRSTAMAALTAIRGDIQRFVAVPQIVLPRSIFDAADDAEIGGHSPGSPVDAVSVYVPAHAPTRGLPDLLASVKDLNAAWLMLETPRDLPVETRIAETARRVTLAKAAGAERVFLPAPLDYAPDAAGWSPTDEYVALRTLFHFLAGKRALAVLPTGPEALALLFVGEDDSACVVAWSWRDPPGAPLTLCGGRRPEIWALSGCHESCVAGGRILVPLSTTPVVVAPVDADAVALQASLALDPDFIPADDSNARPILKLCNPFTEEMTGTMRIRLQAYWRATKEEISFQLSGGQKLEQPLDLVVPLRETAGEKLLGIELDVTAPAPIALSVSLPIRLGLSSVSFDASAWWQGTDLIVEQMVRNLRPTALDCTCSCQAAGRPQLDGALVGVAPGAALSQVFQISSARDLAGSSLIVSLKEPGGRRLDSIVPIPP